MIRIAASHFIAHRLSVLPLIVLLLSSCLQEQPGGIEGTGGLNPTPAQPARAPAEVAIAPDSSGTFGKFAYVVNRYADSVSMYTINGATGALTLIGRVAAGSHPGSVAVDPTGRFAYVVNPGAGGAGGVGSILEYTIDAATGVLTLAGTISSDYQAGQIVVDPSGKFAYVASHSGVAVYALNNTTGALTSVGLGVGAAGLFSYSIAVDPSDRFIYVARPADTVGVLPGFVSTFRIDATSGALTWVQDSGAGIDPGSVTVDPSGKFVYAANEESGDLWVYSIDGSTGGLTSVGTLNIPGNSSYLWVTAHPSGPFAYAVGGLSTVDTYGINPMTGALTHISTVATGSSPSSMAIDQSRQFAYVTNFDSDNVSMYSVDPNTGVLTLVGTIGT